MWLVFALFSLVFDLGDFYILSNVLSRDTLILSGAKYSGIYLLNTDKKELKKISELSGFEVAISPSKKEILTRSEGRVVLINLEGGKLLEINEKGDVGYPIWLDENRFAYPVSGSIKIYDLKSRSVKSVKGVNTSWISWNGRYFVCQEKDSVFLVSLDGKKWRISVDDGKCYSPEFSPNGKYVLYNVLGKGIYIYDLESGENRFVAKGYNPMWSPDGKFIVFNISEDDGVELISSDIYVYHLVSAKIERITNSEEIEIKPIFSPDGSKIFFCTPDGKIGYIDFPYLNRER